MWRTGELAIYITGCVCVGGGFYADLGSSGESCVLHLMID